MAAVAVAGRRPAITAAKPMPEVPDLAATVAIDGPLTSGVRDLLRQAASPSWPHSALQKTRNPEYDFVVHVVPGLERVVDRALGGAEDVASISWASNRVFVRLTDAAISAAAEEDWAQPFAPRVGPAPSAALLYSNPNANKPLHLGHFRQNAMGMALFRLFQAAGVRCKTATLSGDWGIHIAQALVGYRFLDDDERVALASTKPDHVAGWCIAAYHRTLDRQPEVEEEARSLLRRLHVGDPGAVAQWQRMTASASVGHAQTYAAIGSVFDHEISEYQVLASASELVRTGCMSGVFDVRDDESVVADLTNDGMWDVTLVRGDGTTTCYPQHLAGWNRLFEELDPDIALVLIGPDLIPPARTWFAMAQALGLPWANRFVTFAHGLVRSPEGRLRSRFGQSLTIDSVLDRLASKQAVAAAAGEAYDAPGGAEAQAARLLKFAFLRTPRTKDITFDDTALWLSARPRLERLQQTVDAVAPARPAVAATGFNATGGALNPVVREAVLCLDDFRPAAARSVAMLDPVPLVRHAERVVEVLARAGEVPDWLRHHAQKTLKVTMQLLNL